MHEVIVDGQSLRDLIYVTRVDRSMGAVTKNKTLSIHGYIIQDVMQTVDVLNRLLTGNLQEFIFSDQPNRYWMGKVKSDIHLSNSDAWAQLTIEINVPDGISYAVEPKVLSFENRQTVELANDGSHETYPIIDFHLKADTHMVSAVSNKAVFQFGESLEASPLKEVQITRTETTGGHETRRRQTLARGRWNSLSTTSFNMATIESRWATGGSFGVRGGSTPAPSGGQVKVGKWATHWYTGERMANWVHGKTFIVDQTKSVNHSKSKKAYLLKNQGHYIGWLLEQDIDGGGQSASSGKAADMVPRFGSSPGHKWHGPAMRHALNGDCSDYEATTFLNFFKGNNREMGAFYFAVMNGSQVISAIQFSAHQTNQTTHVDFIAGGKGLHTETQNRTLASQFWGQLKMMKKGTQISFEVHNDYKKKIYRQSYNVPELEEAKPTHILVWAGKYHNSPTVSEISAVSTEFVGLDTKVWIKPQNNTVSETVNLPDPPYTWKQGDVIRLDMNTNKGYVNGIETLTPIAYGSKEIKLIPGTQEIALECETTIQPSVEIFYRECFK